MNTFVFHTVNAGIYFVVDDRGVLVDGIHHGQKEGCSEMPSVLLQQLQDGTDAFAYLDAIVFTHLHNDHYSSLYVKEILEKRRGLLRYQPNGETEKKMSLLPISEKMNLLAITTLHEGKMFEHIPHWSLLVRAGEEMFFVAGDAVLTRKLAEQINGLSDSITGVFINPYQLISDSGSEFLSELMPQRIFLYHLPFAEDDVFHYSEVAKQAIRNAPHGLPKVELLQPMTWIDNRIPK